MVNVEKLEKIYEATIDGAELTTKLLNDYGFNSKDLKELVDSNVLLRLKRGHYLLNNVKSLLYYGKKLISVKQYDRADACFEKCYELEPKNPSVCFQLFFRKVKSKNYEESFKYFDVMLNTDNNFYKIDNNFLLLLLSNVTVLPERYMDYINSLKSEDIIVDEKDKRYNNFVEENKFRKAIYDGRYSYALALLKELKNPTVQTLVFKQLIGQTLHMRNECKEKILNLIHLGKYEDLFVLLQQTNQKRSLSNNEKYALVLVQKILDINQNHNIPIKKVLEANNIYEAIDGDNYDLAYLFCTEYNLINNIDSSQNVLHLLLKKITDSIAKIISEQSNSYDKFNGFENKVYVNPVDEELVKQKHELLVNGEHATLLSRMKPERINGIKAIVKRYGDMRVFCIGEGIKKQCVLTYKPKIEERVDFKQVIHKGNVAYKKGQYDECISHYAKLIYFGYTKGFVYAKMGLSYLKKGDLFRAIPYLTIANEQNKKENSAHNFEELLAKLKGIEYKPDPDDKVYFNMALEEFEIGNDDNYGIENFEEIADFIIESGVDVESACLQLLMNSEKVNKIRLLFAREYYSSGNFEKGDQFLKEVEKSQNKTEEVIRILEEIRKNKRFYSNPDKPKTLKLDYLLQPGRRD